MRGLPLRRPLVTIIAGAHLDRADHRGLMMNAAPFAPRLAADEAFIDFDRMFAADPVALRAHHARSQLVQNREGRFIAVQPELPLKLERRLSRRLRCHQVSAPEPHRKRLMAGLHDRSRREGRVLLASPTPQDDRRARPETIWRVPPSAGAANEAFRPAHRFQIGGASSIVQENTLKFRKSGGKPQVSMPEIIADFSRFVIKPDKHGMLDLGLNADRLSHSPKCCTRSFGVSMNCIETVSNTPSFCSTWLIKLSFPAVKTVVSPRRLTLAFHDLRPQSFQPPHRRSTSAPASVARLPPPRHRVYCR